MFSCKVPVSCPILMKTEFSRQILEKYSSKKFHENPFSGSRVVPRGETDGLTGMTKLIDPIHNFADAPENM